MEIDPGHARRRQHSSGLPAICTDDFGPSKKSEFSPTLSSSIAMSIPGSSSPYGDVPPPLPPPKYPPIEGLPYINESRELRRHEPQDSFVDDRENYKMRDRPFNRHEPDEGYHSIGSARTLYSPHFSMHHGYRSTPDSAIDTSMLDKLNSRRTVDARSPSRWTPLSQLSQSAADPRPNRTMPVELPKLLSLPVRSRNQPQSILESPHRYTQTPAISDSSPRSNPFSQPSTGYRSPGGLDPSDFERSPESRTRRTNSGPFCDDFAATPQGGYDAYDDGTNFAMEETSRLHRLNIEDVMRERERGQKRRASSPPCDDPPLPSDAFRRRDAERVSRGSPTPRLAPLPHGSVSSLSSAGRSTASYMDMTTTSSVTSVASFGRRSPPGRSPISPHDGPGYENPFTGPINLNTLSPRPSMNRQVATSQPSQPQQQQHQRALSDLPPTAQGRPIVSPRKLPEPPKSAKAGGSGLTAKMRGFYMCECCPKKPKKFETREELNAHEAEKQYECSYCGNRFKNKNEAERHQNSLHVRRHSWSCSALTSYERAFHESTTRPGEADTCGYCGEEFARTGPPSPQSQGRMVTNQDREARAQHLQEIHKFRECNSSKKFYRADHFRQHLKHSHAGTSGKWTNMLENACMMDEDPPVGEDVKATAARRWG